MCGHTRRDSIRSEDIWDKVEVSPVEDKMREAKLRWFVHVKRIGTYALVRRCERLTMDGFKRGTNSPKKKKYKGEMIRKSMTRLQLPRKQP
ncbi:hypothetical protein H5410_039303 [Solanum commersonii]|uniref:Uncharacterized protein n=1 Tax=Solanum commersonii TaxID=4109 RepID=A0A9J5YDY2_SOLCO|nr:hypothetical protein H5410_039303 [Solanum commersonii]